MEKKHIRMEKVQTERQRADILTNPLAEARFRELSAELGLLEAKDRTQLF